MGVCLLTSMHTSLHSALRQNSPNAALKGGRFMMVASRFTARPWLTAVWSASSMVLLAALLCRGASEASKQSRLCPGMAHRISRTGLTTLKYSGGCGETGFSWRHKKAQSLAIQPERFLSLVALHQTNLYGTALPRGPTVQRTMS